MSETSRRIGFGLLAAAAVIVFIALKPQVPTETPTLPSAMTYESLIQDALDADAANNLLTTGAPQQQVVNGWTAKDLLTIIAKQNIDILKSQGAIVDATGTLNTTPFDERIPALLLIGLLAICWNGISTPTGRRVPEAASLLSPPEPVPADGA